MGVAVPNPQPPLQYAANACGPRTCGPWQAIKVWWVPAFFHAIIIAELPFTQSNKPTY